MGPPHVDLTVQIYQYNRSMTDWNESNFGGTGRGAAERKSGVDKWRKEGEMLFMIMFICILCIFVVVLCRYRGITYRHGS